MTRILVVDDDHALVESVAGILRRQGWEIGVAHDGAEAVQQVKTTKWNAVLMNVRLPKLDGLAALKLMRQIDRCLPVILLAGGAEQGDIFEAYRSGADACLVKSVDEQDVVIAIQEALERSQMSQGRQAPAPTEAGQVSVDLEKKTEPLE